MANEMSEVVKQQLGGRRGENRDAGVRQACHGTLGGPCTSHSRKTELGSPPLPESGSSPLPMCISSFPCPNRNRVQPAGEAPYAGIYGTGFTDPLGAIEVQVSNFRSGQLTPARQNIFWWHKQ